MTDKVLGTDQTGDGRAEFYQTNVSTASDYYPFGSAMPGRSLNPGNYRFGFNGKENDANGEWGARLVQDYGFRLYNPGIGKFLSVDPLAPVYPWYTPYQFAGNTPIEAIDLDGLEPRHTGRAGDYDIAPDPNGNRQDWISDGTPGPKGWHAGLTEIYTVTADRMTQMERIHRNAKRNMCSINNGLSSRGWNVSEEQLMAGSIYRGFGDDFSTMMMWMFGAPLALFGMAVTAPAIGAAAGSGYAWASTEGLAMARFGARIGWKYGKSLCLDFETSRWLAGVKMSASLLTQAAVGGPNISWTDVCLDGWAPILPGAILGAIYDRKINLITGEVQVETIHEKGLENAGKEVLINVTAGVVVGTMTNSVGEIVKNSQSGNTLSEYIFGIIGGLGGEGAEKVYIPEDEKN